MTTEIDRSLLDPPTRAALVMALLAFVLILLGLVVMIRLGARWARRQGKTWRVRTQVGGDYDEQGEPLVGGLPRLESGSKADETVRHSGGVANYETSEETIIEHSPSDETHVE